MVKTLDALIAFLLDEIALCGEEGATASQIFSFAHEFYQDDFIEPSIHCQAQVGPGANVDNVGLSAGFSNETGLSRPMQNIDAAFQAKLWSWLTYHRDVIVTKVGSRNSGSRDESNQEAAREGTVAGASSSSIGDVATQHNHPATNLSQTSYAKNSQPLDSTRPSKRQIPSCEDSIKDPSIRLRVGEERIWYSLTGHGVDWVRCPRMEFSCLSAIASCRGNGVSQLDLIKMTGQDKRSLPRRTAALAEKGYIEKTALFVKKHKTSFLVLKRYAKSKAPTVDLGNDLDANGSSTEAQGQMSWLGDAVSAEAFLRGMFAILKQNKIVTVSDLKWKLGISKLNWQSQLFKGSLRRLEHFGCIQRVHAVTEGHRGTRPYICVKFVREPENQEWQLTLEVPVSEGLLLEDDQGSEADGDVEGRSNGAKQLEPDGQTQAGTNAVRRKEKHLQEVNRVLPQWLPNKPLGNLLFDLVQSTGKDGISTMSLKATSMGVFYSRPLEATLDRFTEKFDAAQPAHIRYLAIIRDTAQARKTYHYQYRTHDSYQALVDEGKASWEAVGISSKGQQEQGKGEKAASTFTEIDEFGFGTLAQNKLAEKDGTATLLEGILSAKTDDVYYTSFDPILCKTVDGEYAIDWGNKTDGRLRDPIVDGVRLGREKRPWKAMKPVNPELPVKSRGRPRKYPKGEEPYSKEGKAKIREQKKLAAENAARERAEKRENSKGKKKRAAQDAGLDEDTSGDVLRPSKRPAVIIDGTSPNVRTSGRLQTKDDVPHCESQDRSAQESEQAVADLVESQPDPSHLGCAQTGRGAIGQDVEITDVDQYQHNPATALLTVVTSTPSKSLVLINPPSSEKPTPKRRGRKKKSSIAVFKIDRLKEMVPFSNFASSPETQSVIETTLPQGVSGRIEVVAGLDPKMHDEGERHARPPRETDEALPHPTTSINLVDDADSHMEVSTPPVDPQDEAANVDCLVLSNGSASPVKHGPQDNIQMEIQMDAQMDAQTIAQIDTAFTNTENPEETELPESGNAVQQETTGADDLESGSDAEEAASRSVGDTVSRTTHVLGQLEPGVVSFSTEETRSPEAALAKNQEKKPSLKRRLAKKPTPKKPNTYERGSINFRRKQIILDLVEKAGGLFPGDRELWYPFSMIWMREYPLAGKPDLRTVTGVQKALTDAGRLKSLKFGFTNAKGLRVEKRIIARMNISADSALVKNLQMKMVEADPSHYIPPEAGMTEEDRKKLGEGVATYPTRYWPTRATTMEDYTGEVTSLRPPDPDISHKTPNRHREKQIEKMVENREEKQRQKDEERQNRNEQRAQQRAQKQSQKLSNQILKLTLAEQRAAASKIQRIAQSVYKDRASTGGPPRVARLHGLSRSSVTQEPSVLASRSSHRPQAQSQPAKSTKKTPELHLMLMSLVYKLHRTSLNTAEQEFNTHSGTFGTFYSSTGRPQICLYLPPRSPTPSPVQGPVHPPAPSVPPVRDVPSSLEDILARTKRRRSSKVDFSAGPNLAHKRFEYEVDQVRTWEERHADLSTLSTSTPSTWSFINHICSGPQAAITPTRPILIDRKRPAESSKDQETFPGAESQRPAKRARALQPSQPRLVIKRPKKANAFKTRILTALPKVGFEPTPLDDEDETCTVLAESQDLSGRTKARRIRRSTLNRIIMTEADVQRLVVAVTVVSTLTGGIDRHIDWVLVARAFPQSQYEAVDLRKKWAPLVKKYKGQLDKLQADFQEAYITAYESGEVDPIDYDDLVHYDWEGLVQWALNILDIPDSQKLPNLPARREQFDEIFKLQNEPEMYAPWRDEYFGILATFLRRSELAHGVSLSTQLFEQGQQKANPYDADEALAKSWVRANILTSENVYNPREAKRKLLQLGEKRVDTALNELCSDKLVHHTNRGRTAPGRNYDVTELFFSTMKKALDETILKKAAAYKAELDHVFATAGSHIFSYNAEDGAALALTNLLAHQRVRLVPRNVPMNKLGVMNGSYRTRFMDKSRLVFEVEMQPVADSYVGGNPLAPFPPVPHQHLNRHDLPIPLWYDIHGNFISVIWDKVVAVVIGILAMRSGVVFEELARCLRPTVERHDLKLVMEWLVEAGAVMEVSGGGWVAGEWWWMVLAPLDGQG